MPEKSLIIINRIFLVLFFFVCLDFFFLHGFLKSFLPETVRGIVGYYYIAGLPHIIASGVSFFNKEYVSFYKKDILQGIFITGSLLSLCLFFSPHLFIYFLTIYTAYTMYHLGRQQIGLCRRFSENKTIYDIWSFSGLVGIIVLGLSIGGEFGVFMPNPLPLFLSYIAICCFPVFAVTGFILFKKKEYPLTSTLLILGACLSIFMGYAVIAVIMLRFVHDISAFCIYVKHDTLFLSKNKKNYLYSLFRIQAKYVYVFLPVFSIFISYFLQVKGNIFVTFIVLLLALNHYYLESVIWKRGSLHREMLR